MIIKSPKSRLSIVNLFADFLLSKIPSEEHTIIQVLDCLNFFLIKGKTSSKSLLDIGHLIDEFKSDLHDNHGWDVDGRKLSHTIDLMEYGVKMEDIENLTYTYHNTESCQYHYSQIESFGIDDSKSYDYSYVVKEITDSSQLIYSSEFPHGYSLSQGRTLYNYGKYIIYNIPPTYPTTTLTLTLSKDPESFIVFDNFSGYEDETLRSAIIDMFDFDMTWMESEMKKVDWSNEITNPLSEYDFLKKKIKDFIII